MSAETNVMTPAAKSNHAPGCDGRLRRTPIRMTRNETTPRPLCTTVDAGPSPGSSGEPRLIRAPIVTHVHHPRMPSEIVRERGGMRATALLCGCGPPDDRGGVDAGGQGAEGVAPVAGQPGGAERVAALGRGVPDEQRRLEDDGHPLDHPAGLALVHDHRAQAGHRL